MPGIAMPGDSADSMAARILQLEKQVQQLITSTRLRNATIDEPGSLQVRDAMGNVRLYAGRIGSGGMGLRLTRADGTDALRFEGFSNDPTFHEVVQLYDRTGNFLYGDDEITGQGLSRPYIPLVPVGVSDLADNVESTTSAAFADLFRFGFPKQHPKVDVHLSLYTDVAGTSGEVDLWDNGTSTRVAGPFAFTGGGGATVLTGSVPGAHIDLTALSVRGRVTSAGGSVGVLVLAAYGRG